MTGHLGIKFGWMIGLILMCLSTMKTHGQELDRSVQEMNADDQCGKDRKCRIERLRKLNQKRRLKQSQHNAQRAIRFQDKLNQNSLKKTPRELYPFSIDLETMTWQELSLAGIGLTWQWLKHLKLIGAYYPSCDVSTNYSSSYNAFLTGRCIKAGIRYLNHTSAFTTYFDLYAMHMLLEGDVEIGSYNDQSVLGGGGGIFDDLLDTNNEYYGVNEYGELETHVLGFGAGVDWMISQRFHLRLGLVTHYVLFASLRDEVSRANLIEDHTEQVLMNEVMSVSFDLSIGYAF